MNNVIKFKTIAFDAKLFGNLSIITRINTHNGYYLGEQVLGLRTGFGEFYFNNGNKYVGMWQNNYMHGKGVLKCVNGESYDGEWKFGKRNGHGTFYYSDGNRLEGVFFNDKVHCEAAIYSKDGRVVKRNWYNGQLIKR